MSRALPAELFEIAEIERCFYEELMSEPPNGHNHGRRKTAGGWQALETDPQDPPSFKHYVEQRKHGTSYTYMKIGCRCEDCRAWQSERMRKYREQPLGMRKSIAEEP